MMRTAAIFLSVISVGNAFMMPNSLSPKTTPTSRRSTSTMLSGGAAEIAKAHDSIFSKLKDTLKVEEADFPSTLDVDTWSKAGFKGEVHGYRGNPRLVWTGMAKSESDDGSKFQGDIAIWVGPLIMVPHLLLSFGADADGIKVFLDYIPRDDLGYTTGNNHLDEYFSKESLEAYKAASKDPVMIASKPVDSFYSRVLLSPTAISIVVQPNAEGAAKAAEWANAHVDRWFNWMNTAVEVQRMKRGIVMSRDNGVRRNWVSAQTDRFNAFLEGKDAAHAKQLAIAVSGPLQEAYVGQAS